MICPVMNLAAGETRNRATCATSSGVPQRRKSDSWQARRCQYSDASSPQAVRIQPGARQLTRTWGASDRARLLRESHDRPFHSGEHFAAVSAHALFRLVPANVQDRTIPRLRLQVSSMR